MYTKKENGDNGLANRKFKFKYIENTWFDGNLISETEKNWSADNLNDYNRFREIWQELEAFDSNCQLTEVGTILEDGSVSMMLGEVFTCEGEAPYFYPDTLTVNEDIVRSWGFTDDDLADTYKYTKEYRCVKGTTM